MYRKVTSVSYLEDMMLRRSLGRRGTEQPVGRKEMNRLATFTGEEPVGSVWNVVGEMDEL